MAKLLSDNKEMLKNLGEQIDKSKNLLESGTSQQALMQDQLAQLDAIHNQTELAVKLGNSTLEEARNIKDTLKRKCIF